MLRENKKKMVIFMAWLAYVLSFSFFSVFNQDRPAEKSSNPISNSCDFKCKRFFGFDFFFAESGNKCSSQQLKCICFLEEKKIRETIDSTTTNDLKSAKERRTHLKSNSLGPIKFWFIFKQSHKSFGTRCDKWISM